MSSIIVKIFNKTNSLKIPALAITLCLLTFSLCYGQVKIDSLEIIDKQPIYNLLFSKFDKQLNTYYLNTGINYSIQFSKMEFSLYENFRSTLFRSGITSIRDEQYFKFKGKYLLSGNNKIGVTANSTIFSDDRNTLINKSNINDIKLFGEFEFHSNFLITPFGGYTTNNQVGEEDKGPVYGLEGSYQDYSNSDYSINSILKLRNEDILPRRDLLRFFDISLNNSFSKNVSNRLAGRIFSSRKDFYLPADSIVSSAFNVVSNIESRTETNYLVDDNMYFKDVIENIDMEVLAALNWRTIDKQKRYKSPLVQSENIFDTQIDELIIGTGARMFYRSSFFSGSLSFNFSERDEKHITKNFEGADDFFFEAASERQARKSNNSRRTTIAITGDFNLSSSDKLTTSMYFNKLIYDTPSSDNDDDRDELLSIFRMRYSKSLSPYFQAFVNAEATISHIVYLFASRSSNNNINRVLRLMAGGHYRGANVSSLNTFEVSANYTVYDFENISSGLRSLSFRQFTATDSSHVKFTKNFAFGLNGYIKLSEQADLNWGEFSERPVRFLREIFADPMFFLTYNHAILGIGLRYFSLSTFNYRGLSRIPDTHYQSIGPKIELSYIVLDSINLKINGWYEFISINDTPDSERINFVMDLNWKF